MDPNAALTNIRKIITDWNETDDTGDATELLDELSTAVEGLDDWLCMGAFLPDAWQQRHSAGRPASFGPWMIQNVANEWPLWWSNELGWTTIDQATRFADDEVPEFNLPIDGAWKRAPETPKLTVVADGEGMLHLKCPDPDCGVLDDIAEVDTAVRVNRNSGFEFHNGTLVALWWGTGDGDFEHTHYQCDSCLLIVDLPEGTDHQALSQEWN